MQYHYQNLTDGYLPLWRHGRAWWWKLGWEWSLFCRVGMWSVSASRLGFGAYLGWFGLHVDRTRGSGIGRRWGVSVTDGGISIEHPWVRYMEWRSSDPWWRKTIRFEVVNWILGRWKHSCDKTPLGDVVVPMPEGCYRATATREERTWVRRFGIRRRRSSVWLAIEGGGIPYSGKGENSWDCGDDGLCGIGGETVEKAIGNAVASALASRARNGLNSRRTGSHPVMAPVSKTPDPAGSTTTEVT